MGGGDEKRVDGSGPFAGERALHGVDMQTWAARDLGIIEDTRNTFMFLQMAYN